MSILGLIGAAGGLMPLTVAAEPEPELTISPGDTAFWAKLRGPVHPSKEVELPAPLGAIVTDVLVEETQRVEADQVLVQLDDAVQRGEVAVKEIEVQYAQANYEEAKETYKHTEEVYKGGAGSEAELRRNKLAMTTREMAVGVAKEQLDLEKVRLDQFKIKAPFAGEIGVIRAEKGARLNPGDVAMTFVSRDPLEARLDLPVALMKRMEVGKEYVFEAGEPVNARIQGRLKTLDRNISFAAKTFRAVFTIDNPDLKLPSGFEVRLLWPQP